MSIFSKQAARKVRLVTFLYFLTARVFAQDSAPAASPDIAAHSAQLEQQLQQIKSAALSDNYIYQQVAYLSENIGPRPSGSQAAKAAVQYVATQMRVLGLDVHLEQIKVPHWVRGIESAELIDYHGHVEGTEQKVILTALGGSSSTGKDGLSADVIVVDDFDRLKSLGKENVAGKIVLFNEPFENDFAIPGVPIAAYRKAVRYRSDGPKAAAELGAVAALVRSVGSGRYRLAHTGDSDRAGIPAAAITAEDAEIIAHLVSQGPVRMHLTLTPQKLPDEASFNVIGDLKGSEHPEQVIVVSGHLDSWDLGTGALDDACGVAVALETARVMQELHLHPKRTIRVIAWMDEETNESGSQQYVKEHATQFANHIAALESDVGAARPLGFQTSMSQSAIELLKPVQKVLASIGADSLEHQPHPPGTTDVSAMAEAGVPIIGVMQDGRHYYDYHHTAADTFDKVDATDLRANAAAVAVMTYALAEMEHALPR